MKKFDCQFEVEKRNTLTYECSLGDSERLEARIENGDQVLYANKEALITLAKILIKMGLGDYDPGFHVHLKTNFSADESECIRVTILK